MHDRQLQFFRVFNYIYENFIYLGVINNILSRSYKVYASIAFMDKAVLCISIEI